MAESRHFLRGIASFAKLTHDTKRDNSRKKLGRREKRDSSLDTEMEETEKRRETYGLFAEGKGEEDSEQCLESSGFRKAWRGRLRKWREKKGGGVPFKGSPDP